MTERRGLGVAFLGVDGIGVGRVVAAVEERCAAEGIPARRATWQRSFGDPAVGTDLERVWVDLYRVFFAGATVGGAPLAVPEAYADFAADPVLRRVKELPVAGMLPEAPLATGWMEVAGHTAFLQDVVAPLVAAGTVVLQDSLGVKNVLKSLLMAEHAAPGAADALARARADVRAYFGAGLPPDLGIHLVGEPEPPGPTVSPFDSHRGFGADPADSHRDLQARAGAEYARFAEEYGWYRVDVGGGPDAAAGEVLELLRAARG